MRLALFSRLGELTERVYDRMLEAPDENDHGVHVDSWMVRCATGLPPDRLLGVTSLAFTAVWQRARHTLGDVTLTAIVERVLQVAGEHHPALRGAVMDDDGLRCESIRLGFEALAADDRERGVRFLLVELLTVLGSLTGEILTPALHQALATTSLAKGADGP